MNAEGCKFIAICTTAVQASYILQLGSLHAQAGGCRPNSGDGLALNSQPRPCRAAGGTHHALKVLHRQEGAPNEREPDCHRDKSGRPTVSWRPAKARPSFAAVPVSKTY